MYRNPYTQEISDKVDANNRRLIAHLNAEQMDSFEGSGRTTQVNNASKCPCGQMPCRCYGDGMSGGSGFASGTKNDSGFEPTIGAGGGKGSRTYKKKAVGCGQIASLPPPENVPELGNVGAGMMPIKDTVMPEKVKRTVGGRKKGKGMAELKSDLAKFDMNRIKDYVGLGGSRDVPQKVVEKNVMVPVMGGGKCGGADGRKKRAEIVKKVMAEKGMKMIEASKYVKQHNLYWKNLLFILLS